MTCQTCGEPASILVGPSTMRMSLGAVSGVHRTIAGPNLQERAAEHARWPDVPGWFCESCDPTRRAVA